MYINCSVFQDQLSRTTGSGGGEVGGARGRGPPRVMPVSVPVAQSPGTTNAHIQQVCVSLLSTTIVYSTLRGRIKGTASAAFVIQNRF